MVLSIVIKVMRMVMTPMIQILKHAIIIIIPIEMLIIISMDWIDYD